MAFALFSVSLNIFGAKHLPLFEGVILFFNIVGFFAVMIPLWVLAPKAPSSEVWTSFSNGGDWSSVGAACIIGILTPAGSFIGADSAAHMSEEVRNASLSVPRVMMFTVMLNGVLGFIAIVTFVSETVARWAPSHASADSLRPLRFTPSKASSNKLSAQPTPFLILASLPTQRTATPALSA